MIRLTDGQVLDGRFRIDGLAPGGGGQAISYKGTNLKNNAPVFIKHYCYLWKNDLSEQNIFYSEIFRKLDEKAKKYLCLPEQEVCTQDYKPIIGVQDDHVYTVFEFIDGQTLENIYHNHIPEWDLRRFLKTIFKICMSLEDEGIAHLDIKPDNFLVNKNRNTERNYIKLIDMDNARICDDITSPKKEYSGILQDPVATPFYSAPELINQEQDKISSKSDSFSLAMVLVDLLIGRNAFHQLNDMDQFYEGNCQLRLPTNDLHSLIGAMIQKCLNFNPDERFPVKNMYYTIRRCAGTYFRKKKCHVCIEDTVSGKTYRFYEDQATSADKTFILNRSDLNPIVPRLPENSIKFKIDETRSEYTMTVLSDELEIYRNNKRLSCEKTIYLEIPQPQDSRSRHLPEHKIKLGDKEYRFYLYLQEEK